MSVDEVRERIKTRLDVAGRGDRGGDRGWFLLTRVHPAIPWLRAIAQFLRARGDHETIQLTDDDYHRLGQIIGSSRSDPGVQLRRHHLLMMDTPLQLIERINRRRWEAGIQLTGLGHELAESPYPANVLEKSLRQIRFALEPWTTSQRVRSYSEFNVRAYEVTLGVLEHSDGYIDRDEFDLFVSRIRRDDECDWAIEGINAYRRLNVYERQSLKEEVRSRTPSEKVYQNWRDVGLHTFSLFGLGISTIRDRKCLLLTNRWPIEPFGAHSVAETTTENTEVRTRALRIPSPSDCGELISPPAIPAANDGSEAESLVAKLLHARHWEVIFYTNKRGYGFDLWARRGTWAMVIEVKSSLGALDIVTLTELEYQAAIKYGRQFVLALVENIHENEPSIQFIENPAEKLCFRQRDIASHVVARSDWIRAVTDRT